MYLGVTGMRKDVYINKDLYKRINDIEERAEYEMRVCQTNGTPSFFIRKKTNIFGISLIYS